MERVTDVEPRYALTKARGVEDESEQMLRTGTGMDLGLDGHEGSVRSTGLGSRFVRLVAGYLPRGGFEVRVDWCCYC